MLACLFSLIALDFIVLIETNSDSENAITKIEYPTSSAPPPVDLTLTGNISLLHDWTAHGKPGGSFYEHRDVCVDNNDNVYVIGATFDLLDHYVYIEKYNSLGQFQWNLSWNGGLDIESLYVSAEVNQYQEIFVTGGHRVEDGSVAGTTDVYLLKVNSGGSVGWVRSWGSEYFDIGYGVACDSSGNPFVTGQRFHNFVQKRNILLLKYDRSGNLLWDRGWNYATSSDLGASIKIDSNDNIYITGFAQDSDVNLCLLKYNSSGDFEWSQIWNPSDYAKGIALAIDSIDNINVIALYKREPGNIDTASLLKFNSSGSLKWNISMPYYDDTEFFDVIVDPFDNIYISGKGYFYNISHQFYLLKFNSSGQAENYGYSDNLGSGTKYLDCDSFGNIFLTGWFDYEIHKPCSIAKYDADCDNDGLINRFEIDVSLTDPNDPDCDNDNLTDGEEYEGNIYWKYPASTDPLNPDCDNDNLTDFEELIIYLSDPWDNDTDNDNLSDGEEVITHNTNPLASDSDSDGLSDELEVNSYNTNPLSNDTDSDTMLDKWEVDNALDPLVNDTLLDPDLDFLTNLDEYLLITDPNNNDTDNDFLSDGQEIYSYGTNPLVSDTDSDGVLDGNEVNIHGTDPLDSDSDSDGLSDGSEINLYITNPLSNDTDSDTMDDKWEVDNSLFPTVNDSYLDRDSDGLLNIEEYQMDCDPQDDDTDDDGWLDGTEVHTYGTDPTDPNSHPNPQSPEISGFPLFIIGLASFLSIIPILHKIRLKKIK